MTYIVTSENLLSQVVAPNLPQASPRYERIYFEQYNNILRLYFNQLDKIIGQLQTSTGGSVGPLLQFPYGAFHDSTTQTAGSTTTAYAITLNTTDISNTVSIVSGSRITFATAGIYNVQISAQLANYDVAPQDIDIWYRLNGTDIANSNSRFGMAARKTPTDPFHMVGTVNILVTVAATNYVELVWCTTNLSAKIEAYVAGTTPTRPAVPSVIVTATFVSAL